MGRPFDRLAPPVVAGGPAVASSETGCAAEDQPDLQAALLRSLWQKAWPASVRPGCHYPHGPVPLSEYLRAWARVQPQKAAVVFYGHTLSYGELDRESDRFAALLQQHGIAEGDRVSVMMPNCPQFHMPFSASSSAARSTHR